MSYLNSITHRGFVGSDPEQRQAKGNGSKFTVLSVATQRSWKNADDEWSSKRVASSRCVPATFGRACRYDYQEGRSRTRRRLSRQLDLRTTERQRQEVEDLEDYVVVRRADVCAGSDRGEPEPNAPAPAQAPESNEAAL